MPVRVDTKRVVHQGGIKITDFDYSTNGKPVYIFTIIPPKRKGGHNISRTIDDWPYNRKGHPRNHS